jgi:hypothetical protein
LVKNMSDQQKWPFLMQNCHYFAKFIKKIL